MPRPSDQREPEPVAHAERRSQIRGLLLLALAAIVFAILRAGLHSAFPHSWWRLW